jgi:ribosome biogenesis protein BMS1
MKIRPIVWRTSHGYIVSDRMEDKTHPEDIRQNPNVPRKVLFGILL